MSIGGIFLYVAPIEGRLGMDEFEIALINSGFECNCKQLASSE